MLGHNLSKEAFIATATAISILIDLTRIPVYIYQEARIFQNAPAELVAVMICAFAGTFLGKKLLKKIPPEKFRPVVAGFLVVVGVRLLL